MPGEAVADCAGTVAPGCADWVAWSTGAIVLSTLGVPTGVVGFGDGKIQGVTPMTTALRRSARKNRLSIYGIGSNPPALNGWQREILFAASSEPFTAPCFSIASIAYCEQVG